MTRPGLTTVANRRVCEARVAIGNALADAVPCLSTRERLAGLIDQYAALAGAQARGETWREAMASAERIQQRGNGHP